MAEEAHAESIGERLRRLRLERGLSQRELSSPGVSYAYISRIEAGARRPSVKALRVTSPRPARPICAGRSSKRPCTRTGQPPRPRPLPGHPRAARHDGGQTDRRPQDRQAGLPRPARARARLSLSGRISRDALPLPPEPGSRRLRFGMSRLLLPRLDNLRRDSLRAEIGMGLPRPRERPRSPPCRPRHPPCRPGHP